jgi:protein-S-isoprenylcysteine O-methyltransferase Ste14
METNVNSKLIKRSFFGALAFYLLIAFEFFYMAGPFAAYFYSVYAPILNFFNSSPELAWLSQFFLPHAVRDTSSFLINSLEIAGAALAIAGFLAFCVGACQVYYHKIRRKGIVTGGIYNRVRHPQYASFIVCSFGLLLLWPRYIVAVLFVTMLFFYYLLAKAEEAECERKFGQPYIDFKNRTSMFLPFKLSFLPELPRQKSKKAASVICLYLLAITMVLGAAKGLNTLAVDSLYATYTDRSANIALSRMSDEKINDALSIALSDETVAAKMAVLESGASFINYVLPTEWFAAEIPMNGVEYTSGHSSPGDYDPNLYKVIITKASAQGGAEATGKEILTSVYLREPVAEVWVDISAGAVTEVLDMLEEKKYQGIPVAVY